MLACSSTATTSWPRRASSRAAMRPAGPAPTTTTSRTQHPSESAVASELPAPRFPCAQHANPKRQQNQSHVEPEGVPPDVDPVVAELVPSRHVAGRVDLRDAGQTRTHRDARGEARHVFETFEPPVARRFDLARAQRARADEAHVA